MGLVQIQQHELARVQVETLADQRRVHRSAEGHQLRFDAREMRNGAHGDEQLLEKARGDGILREFGGNIQAADQPFLIFEDVE